MGVWWVDGFLYIILLWAKLILLFAKTSSSIFPWLGDSLLLLGKSLSESTWQMSRKVSTSGWPLPKWGKEKFATIFFGISLALLTAKMKSSLDAMACGSAVILKVFPAPWHIAPPTLKGAFVDSAVCSVPGHGWGSHAVDCTKVLASTRNHDSLPVAIEWKHFVCLVAVKLEAVQSHAILAGCCKRTPN